MPETELIFRNQLNMLMFTLFYLRMENTLTIVSLNVWLKKK